jgi:hypothetical protein
MKQWLIPACLKYSEMVNKNETDEAMGDPSVSESQIRVLMMVCLI